MSKVTEDLATLTKIVGGTASTQATGPAPPPPINTSPPLSHTSDIIQPATTLQSTTITNAIQLAVTPANETMPITFLDARHLEDTVEPKLKARIWAQEYIELSELVTAVPELGTISQRVRKLRNAQGVTNFLSQRYSNPKFFL
jgi:hypothetical protein